MWHDNLQGNYSAVLSSIKKPPSVTRWRRNMTTEKAHNKKCNMECLPLSQECIYNTTNLGVFQCTFLGLLFVCIILVAMFHQAGHGVRAFHFVSLCNSAFLGKGVPKHGARCSR